jgi:hypothetical protein
MANQKYIPHNGKWTSSTFNALQAIQWGLNVRLRGLVVTSKAYTEPKYPNDTAAYPSGGVYPGGTGVNASNTLVTPTTPGAFIYQGITVQINDAISPIAVAGSPPYALTAVTASDDPTLSDITFAVESYTAGLELTKAVLAVTDNTGFNWTPATPLGIWELSQVIAANQLTSQELALLTVRDGNIDDANLLHAHRGTLRDQTAFETITNLDYNQFPHVPLGRNPVSADSYHIHKNLLTDNEITVLTGRGGIENADSEHTHAGLVDSAAFAALTGGPNSDASAYHYHPIGAHGNITNPHPTIVYVPQNTGSGTATINATNSTFTGSLALLLGPSTTGGPVNAVIGIQYKQFARFFFSTVTSAIGTNTVVGVPVTLQTELFTAGAPSGIVSPVLFGQSFTWKGCVFQVTIPEFGAVPFVTSLDPTNTLVGDTFSYHGVVAAATPLPGFPGCPVTPTPVLTGINVMHEKMLSRAPLKLVPVLDERYPEGGVFTCPYI